MFQAFNILRYEIGQKYNSHYDAFHPSEYGPQKSQRVMQIKTQFIVSCFSGTGDIINLHFVDDQVKSIRMILMFAS